MKYKVIYTTKSQDRTLVDQTRGFNSFKDAVAFVRAIRQSTTTTPTIVLGEAA